MGDIHDDVALRLRRSEQRYTPGRRAVVEALLGAGRPLTVPEILDGTDRRTLPQSSAYRNLTVLVEAGVAHRLPGTDEFARYELAEELAGHHHHLHCDTCGVVADVSASPRLEKALADAASAAADESGFQVTGHRIELVGRCADCQ